MKLNELLNYDNIVIQCHDNPDADSIASGFALLGYFKKMNRKARLIYRGQFRIRKANLLIMVRELDIPIEYHPSDDLRAGLLIIVDCQHGEGNITEAQADEIAVIDHHQASMICQGISEVRPGLGSCSTIIWDMLMEEGIDVNDDDRIATALYYGLYSDTNSFSELHHPLDMDLRDYLVYDKSIISKMCNSNFTLKELKIAGLAMLGYEYHDVHRYAIIGTEPCDPNILGLISDFFLEADAVDVCIVYNILDNGIKFSVRSCVNEVNAGELADYVSYETGSSGGRRDKAGGLIYFRLLERNNDRLRNAEYDMREYVIRDILRHKMQGYFEDCEVLNINLENPYIGNMERYRIPKTVLGFVRASDMFNDADKCILRSVTGDIEINADKNTYLIIDVGGEAYPIRKDGFEADYQYCDLPYNPDMEYQPTVKNIHSGQVKPVLPYAKPCEINSETEVYARPFTNFAIVSTDGKRGRTMRGRPGDYLMIRRSMSGDVQAFIVKKNLFERKYVKA